MMILHKFILTLNLDKYEFSATNPTPLRSSSILPNPPPSLHTMANTTILKQSDQVTLIQWIFMLLRMEIKLSNMAYMAFHNLGPAYLCELLHLFTPIHSLPSLSLSSCTHHHAMFQSHMDILGAKGKIFIIFHISIH